MTNDQQVAREHARHLRDLTSLTICTSILGNRVRVGDVVEILHRTVHQESVEESAMTGTHA